MTDPNRDAQELLYRAFSTPRGIEVTIEPGTFRAAVQRLYRARREANDPALQVLQFRSGPSDSTLWIVRGGQAGTPAPNETLTLESLL